MKGGIDSGLNEGKVVQHRKANPQIKKAFCLITLFLILGGGIVAPLECERSQKSRDVRKIKEAKAIDIVVNEKNPQGPALSLRFEQDLSITEKLWIPMDLLVDEKGNIYTFYDGLKKFNSQGIEVKSRRMPTGQGPGEFQKQDACISRDGFLYIFDPPQRRLTVMDDNLEIQRIQKLDYGGMIFQTDSKGNMYFLNLKFIPKTTDRQKLVLTKFSPSGIPQYEIHEYEWGMVRDSKGIYHHAIYPPQLKYKINSQDNIYYAMSDKYEINIVNQEGILTKRILKKGLTRKITQKEITKYKPKSAGPRPVFDMPEYMPAIVDLFVLDNHYLLVVTFENDDDEPTLAGDLFDERGVYRARVQIPKYFSWYALVQPKKSNAVYKNGYFYTIESDQDEENFYLKRYKLI